MSTPKNRLESLDAFRGLTIAGMILVNNGTGSERYSPLKHADWHGWTPTDLVFPSFLLIAGVAIPLAFSKRTERGDSTGSLVAKVLRRTALIFAIGMLMNAFPGLWPRRFPGVLQRIALCYMAASLLFLFLSRRALIITTIALLVGYWAAMMWIPVPGVGAGDLSMMNNLAARVDRGVLSGHLYKKDYDPEGLLSTIPAVATTLIGVLTGLWFLNARPISEKVAGVFAAGSVLVALGAFWGLAFPINKALWTSSFALYSAGWSLLILGLFGWFVEVEGAKRWAWPFLVFGANPLAAYVFSGLLMSVISKTQVAGPLGETVSLRALIYRQGFASWADPSLASFLFALGYVIFWLLLMSVLYRFKVFIRL